MKFPLYLRRLILGGALMFFCRSGDNTNPELVVMVTDEVTAEGLVVTEMGFKGLDIVSRGFLSKTGSNDRSSPDLK